MQKVTYLGPQESYGFLWNDGEHYRFEKDATVDVPDAVAVYVTTQLNTRNLPLGREAHDSGAQVFEKAVDVKPSRKVLALGGDD